MELSAGDGSIYAHYLGKHPEYGDAVTVSPRLRSTPVQITHELFHGGYVVFYPASAAVNKGMAAVVGHLSSPAVPTRLRRPGVRHGSEIETWIIEDGSGERVRKRLSDEELALPIAAIWNHELLVQRISEKWRPESEGRHE